MPDLPSALALTSIATDADVLSAPLRNNYSAIETAVNALITALSGGAASQALIASDTDTVGYAYPPGYELGYAEFTSNVTVTATSSGSANSVVSSGAVTYDGTAVWVEFYAPAAAQGTNNIQFELYDGTSSLGRFALPFGSQTPPINFKRKLTPSAGSHTYNVKAYVDAGSGTVFAGAGGAASTTGPGFIRVSKA